MNIFRRELWHIKNIGTRTPAFSEEKIKMVLGLLRLILFIQLIGTMLYCEGNGWQYTWLVPHDVEGLISLLGGDDAFVSKLDSLFSVNADLGDAASPDISGLIGQYAHGNEPGHHTVYLYSYAGLQWKTAEKVDYILSQMYHDSPDGLQGNEDCGQMSSWYVFSSLGFYPVNPSNGIYVFGRPDF